MSLRICLDCTTPYAVGLSHCPHCRSERSVEQGSDPYRGDNMPKITRLEGPSIADDVAEEEAAEPVEGGEDVSAGSSTGTSSEKPPKSDEPNSSGSQSPARKTGNRSAKGRTASSTAPSADGGQTAATSDSADD